MKKDEFKEAVKGLKKGDLVRVSMQPGGYPMVTVGNGIYVGKMLEATGGYLTLGIKGEGMRHFLFARIRSIESVPPAVAGGALEGK